MNITYNKIYCQEHNDKSIQIKEKTFQLFCSECEKNGLIGIENLRLKYFAEKDEINNILENNFKKELEKNNHLDDTLNKYLFCYKHSNDEGLFYCDDCFEFICKSCFALDHRNHNCSTPELIEKSMKENLDKLLTDLELLKNNVENKINSVKELDDFFSNQRNDLSNNLKNMNEEITKNINIKLNELKSEVENIFNGIDSEVENSSQRLYLNQKKANKMLEDFKEIFLEVERIKSDKKICLYKKSKDAMFSENKKFLNDLQIFMNENLEKTKKKSICEMETFLKKCSIFQKNSEIYENSIVNTINSGIPLICMRIRRFRRYFFINSRYLKTSSLCFSTSHSINLVGLSLCGLFNNKTPNNKLDFELKLYELDTDIQFDEKKIPLYEAKIKMSTICNVVDPVFQIYLSRTVQINKDKCYLIIIKNLENNCYIDVWTGEIIENSNSKLDQQSVYCNNTGVKFTFMKANGVQSDFDEFTDGLISDIIFSHVD